MARALVRGLRKNRFMILPGFDGKLTYYAKRLVPGLVAAIMDWDVRKVQKATRKNRKVLKANAANPKHDVRNKKANHNDQND